MKALARALVPLVLIIAAAVLWLWPNTDDNDLSASAVPAAEQLPEQSQIVEPDRRIERPSQMVGKSKTVSLPEMLPPSLAGTSVPDGWALVDNTGSLIPTPELRQMFEYFLSALGEESLQQLVLRIEKSLRALDEPARGQALETLGAYLDYKLAIADLEESYDNSGQGRLDAAQVRQRMDEIQALRRTWLDNTTADAFFGEEEAIDGFQAEQMRIVQNSDLTDEQRQEAIARAEAALPEPLRKAREETRRFTDYEQARQKYADNPAALQAWRNEVFGAEAGQRLADLDQEQKAWDNRWQAYSDERAALMSSGLAGPDLDTAIDRLRARHFNETEQIRAQALDSIR